MNTDREFVDSIKQRYTKGTVIVLDQMGDDPQPIDSGIKGTVLQVDDIGTVHCSFENGRKLGLIPGEDSFHILAEKSLDSFHIRPMTEYERMYAYTQSQQIMGQTGCIGHLRADMDTNGKGFFSSWDDHRGYLKTPEFKAEFDSVINELRGDFLADRTALSKYCYSHPESAYPDDDMREFGFRADTEQYSYMMRLNPNKGEYNLYCYCYKKDWLDQHLSNAENGIRFIDSSYRELFRLPDGGMINIVAEDDTAITRTCRYIDPTHLEVGRELYHICEFAELMEKNKQAVMPVTPIMEIPHKHKNEYER